MSYSDLDKILKTLNEDSLSFILQIASKLVQQRPIPHLPNDAWNCIFQKFNACSEDKPEGTNLYQFLDTTSQFRFVCREWQRMLDCVYTKFRANNSLVKQVFYCAVVFKNKPILTYIFDRHLEPSTQTQLSDAIQNSWNVACDARDLSLFKLLLSDSRSLPHYDLYKIILDKVVLGGHADVFCMLMSNKHFSPLIDNKIIKVATNRGQEKIIKVILDYYKFSDNFTVFDILLCASLENKPNIVALLLKDPRVDPCLEHARALHNAISSKSSHVVKVLLADERIANRKENKYLLFDAVLSGSLTIVKMLLKHAFTDPALHNNYAYRLAMMRCVNPKIAKYLLKVQNITQNDISKLSDTCRLAGENPTNKKTAYVHVTCNNMDDTFGIFQEGITGAQIAEKCVSIFGYKRAISWETQYIGRRSEVRCLLNTNNGVEPLLGKVYPWICDNDGKSYPIIFSLICER